MARMLKIDYQMHCRMEKMKCIDESRHQAKKEYKEMMGKNEANITIGINSYKTYDAYKQTSIELIRYIRSEFKDVKDISEFKKEHGVDYLKHRQSDGKNAYNISKDMAALNKLLNFHITKREAGINRGSYKNVTRSRQLKEHDKKYNPENYNDQIIFAKVCGCRRESVLVVAPECFIWKDGLPIKVYLIEKGGKEREATILKAYREDIKSILSGKEEDKPLFDRYTKKIDNHAFRGEYARNRYKELVEEKGFDAQDYRGYDSDVLRKLTKDLGHNRLDVVVYHYLR